MSTNWALPNNVSQYSESGAEDRHVSWNDERNFSALKIKDQTHIKTNRELLHIARDPKHDIIEKTYFLKITNFQFTNIPSTISGIEVKLTMNRFGRITDDTIQLTLDDNLIGNNFADLNLSPIKTYGSFNDLWNTSLTPADVSNASFGIVLRFQSHPKWPHRSSALIDAAEIRVH
ncbi:MAG: hypothetical protein EBX47_06140 [Synechococcaceae bacterium WB8_1B_057]|nr:hypothetical protein [Synechococcaceae bacterium WB8_1B_057]